MPQDTSADAQAVQLAVYQRMSGGHRVALMLEMAEDAREITLAGLRRQHPHWSQKELTRAERIRRLGPELTAAAWPDR